MAHQCLKCGTIQRDTQDILKDGCEKCSNKYFMFVKKENLAKSTEMIENLSEDEKSQIEKDILELLGVEEDEAPVILDFESIRVSKPGKFELDLVQLFNKENPLVYKLEEGKYIIDIPETFQRRQDLKKD